MSFEQWRETFAVNIDSVFHMCRAFVPGMVERRFGRVINVSSTSFMEGMENYTHYNAAKGAVPRPRPDHRLRPAGRRHVRGIHRGTGAEADRDARGPRRRGLLARLRG